jgi:hypothetical protein
LIIMLIGAFTFIIDCYIIIVAELALQNIS